MTFGLSGAAIAGLAVGGATLASGYMSSKAAGKAADAQAASSEAGIAEQQRQFDAIQKLLSPYVNAGTGGLTGQQDLLGLNGNNAQEAAIAALKASPQFTSAQQLGEERILANASATGGLRGGNTQAALSQFSPALLAATINDQYAKLGGIASMGLGAATQTGAFGQASTNNVTQLLQQQGAAQAGGYLGQAAGYNQALSSIGAGLGAFRGLGGKF